MSQQSTVSLVDLCAVGIDVSKESLSIGLRCVDGSTDTTSIRNNETDITEFITKELTGYVGKIIMESTGWYHYLVATILFETGFDVRVINPLISKKYSSGTIRKVKTDNRDAVMLAEIALKEEKLPRSFSSDRKDLEIRKKIGLLSSLENQCQEFNATIKNYQESKDQLNLKLSITEENLLAMIATMNTLKQNLEKEISTLSNQSEDKAEQVARFSTIPGVSHHLATISAYFFDPEVSDDSKQWIAYAGLDVSIKQSGKWTGHGRLTKRGNAYLRKRFFCSAWGAMMHNAKFKEYYQYLKAQHRSHVEALTIISRKLVRIMFTLSKKQSVYDPSLLNFPALI
ncbi:MAG: IS110 family transposase [bacterium]